MIALGPMNRPAPSSLFSCMRRVGRVLQNKPLSGCRMASTMASTGGSNRFRLGMCQMTVGSDKMKNLAVAEDAVREAVSGGAQVVILPEIFNGPYATSEFPKFAEQIPPDVDPDGDSPSIAMLSRVAKEQGIFLVGGSIPEVDAEGRYYNTSTVWNPEGEMLAKYRKVHLFDIDVPGRITFRESDILSPGDTLATFDTPWTRFGLGICYDMRFPQLGLALRKAGAKFLVYPGAFNMTTGPAHWELLQRGRALDNQCYVAAVSQARNMDASYHAWGHSTLTDPWGTVVTTTEEEPTVMVQDIDMSRVDEVRTQIALGSQAREDLYTVEWKGKRQG